MGIPRNRESYYRKKTRMTMKTKHILLSLLCGCMFGAMLGCAEDKGNYDYTPVNEIKIEGIKDNYNCVPGAVLSIPVTLTNSVETPVDKIEYAWEVKGEVVSTQKDLELVVDDIGFGVTLCRFVVTDNNTGMKYFKTFNLTMTNVFSWGYYFLTEGADHHTILSYTAQNSDDDDEEKVKKEAEFAHTTAIEGHDLGSYPTGIEGFFQRFSQYEGYYYAINIMSREGEYPVIETDNAAFLLNKVINSSYYIDKTSGYKFNPESIIMINKNRYFYVTNGQLVVYNYQNLYRPARHDKEYYWTHPVLTKIYEQIVAYDDYTGKFYALNPLKGVDNDDNAYDMVTEITFPGVANPPSFNGHHFLGASTAYVMVDEGKPTEDWINLVNIISGDANGLYFTELNTSYERSISVERPDPPRTTYANVTGIDANSQALKATTYWYVSAGDKVYRSPDKLPVFEVFTTIPSELGKIVHMQPNAGETLLVIATYDESSSADRKGSVVIVDLTTKEMTVYKNVIDKCVSILAADGWPASWK